MTTTVVMGAVTAWRVSSHTPPSSVALAPRSQWCLGKHVVAIYFGKFSPSRDLVVTWLARAPSNRHGRRFEEEHPCAPGILHGRRLSWLLEVPKSTWRMVDGWMTTRNARHRQVETDLVVTWEAGGRHATAMGGGGLRRNRARPCPPGHGSTDFRGFGSAKSGAVDG